jgi:uncharacterized protein (TIGR02145 family)
MRTITFFVRLTQILKFFALLPGFLSFLALQSCQNDELENKAETITDIDGNHYRIVEICGQWWMAENLRTTKFNDGTKILYVTGTSEWEGLDAYHTPAFCWYNNDIANRKIYGALYSEGAVVGLNGKNVCPVGWHVADGDWFKMIKCIDPDANDYGVISLIAGNMVNETGTKHWNCSDNPSTNLTGLTLLPGGFRFINEPPFNGIGEFGSYWMRGSGKLVFHCDGLVSFSEGWDNYGLAVRCVKDE